MRWSSCWRMCRVQFMVISISSHTHTHISSAHIFLFWHGKNWPSVISKWFKLCASIYLTTIEPNGKSVSWWHAMRRKRREKCVHACVCLCVSLSMTHSIVWTTKRIIVDDGKRMHLWNFQCRFVRSTSVSHQLFSHPLWHSLNRFRFSLSLWSHFSEVTGTEMRRTIYLRSHSTFLATQNAIYMSFVAHHSFL